MSARDRLLDTARELFMAEGIGAVGINTVTDAAGVARMTLYNNFASKDALVEAVYARESERRRAAITAAQAARATPIDKVLAVFDVAIELAGQSGFRGCAFINLAIEVATPDSALHALVRDHKQWIANAIRTPLAQGRFAGSATLATQIAVLWDGGIVGAYIHQSDRPIRSARKAAQTLLHAASP